MHAQPQAHRDADAPAGPNPVRPLQANQRPSVPAAGRRLSSRDLLGSCQEIEIAHGESIYRLRLTSQGKLILTK